MNTRRIFIKQCSMMAALHVACPFDLSTGIKHLRLPATTRAIGFTSCGTFWGISDTLIFMGFLRECRIIDRIEIPTYNPPLEFLSVSNSRLIAYNINGDGLIVGIRDQKAISLEQFSLFRPRFARNLQKIHFLFYNDGEFTGVYGNHNLSVLKCNSSGKLTLMPLTGSLPGFLPCGAKIISINSEESTFVAHQPIANRLYILSLLGKWEETVTLPGCVAASTTGKSLDTLSESGVVRRWRMKSDGLVLRGTLNHCQLNEKPLSIHSTRDYAILEMQKCRNYEVLGFS